MTQAGSLTPVSVVDEMKSAYLDYSMAVLVGRAIPDLFDGLKPSTRRTLAAMKGLNLRPDGRFMKCARVDGETTGKYHPHGGVYGAMVTAAAWWTNNHPLIDIHGNGGSPTDNAAAPRYTECKVSSFAWDVLLQDSDTWVTKDNYDGSLQEPVQLNARVPVLLLNGSEGIGVGFATRIPTHNLRGVAKALRALAEDDIKAAKNALAPDFPTGCDIVKDEGLVEYLNTGVGAIRMRAKCEREEIDYGKRSKRMSLVFTNLPLHSNTEQIGNQVKEAIEKGKITTVADVRDETDRHGIRLVLVLKANADVDRAESEIFRNTSLDSKFSAHNLSIDHLKPVQLAPHDMLIRWVGWRDERLLVALKSELEKRRSRVEVVQGLITALTIIDDVILTIRASKDKADARKRLEALQFTPKQADAILDMRLSALTKLDEKELQQEAKSVQQRIKQILALTSSEKLRKEHVIKEVEELAERYGNARRSKAIDEPKYTKVATVVKVGKEKVEVAQVGPKPRFILLDEDRSILTQLKGPRGATMIVQPDEKVVLACDNGQVYKLGAWFKGPVYTQPTKVLGRVSTNHLPSISWLAVWDTSEGTFANSISWDLMSRTTTKGKRWLPEGAKLRYFGPDTYTLEYTAKKRKPRLISASQLKPKGIGSRGHRLAAPGEVA